MESNILQSLTGTAPASGDARTKHSDKPDGDMFSACLDDASKTKAESGKANVQMIDDNKKKEPSKKEESKKSDSASEAQAATTKAGIGKMSPAMQKLMHINPDTLSMADKQALRVGEFSRENEAVAKAGVSNGFGSLSQMPASALSHAARTSAAPAEPGAQKVSEKKFALEDDREVTEKKARHAREEDKAHHNTPGLEQMLNREVQATEQVSKADLEKAYEQRQSMLDQIIKHVEVRNFKNQTEMNLRLNPEYLGEMKISLVHDKEGGIKTNIQTSSKLTRDLMKECGDELVTQANDKGIRLGKINVLLVDKLS